MSSVGKQWSDFLVNIYRGGKPPLMGTVDIKEIEDKAREAMKDDIRKFMLRIIELHGSDQ